MFTGPLSLTLCWWHISFEILIIINCAFHLLPMTHFPFSCLSLDTAVSAKCCWSISSSCWFIDKMFGVHNFVWRTIRRLCQGLKCLLIYTCWYIAECRHQNSPDVKVMGFWVEWMAKYDLWYRGPSSISSYICLSAIKSYGLLIWRKMHCYGTRGHAAYCYNWCLVYAILWVKLPRYQVIQCIETMGSTDAPYWQNI